MMVKMKVLYSVNENVGTTADHLSPATFDLLGPSNPESNAGRLEHINICSSHTKFARMKEKEYPTLLRGKLSLNLPREGTM